MTRPRLSVRITRFLKDCSVIVQEAEPLAFRLLVTYELLRAFLHGK